MDDQYFTPIVVTPDTPTEYRQQLPQFELNDDFAQDWPTSSNDTYNKDAPSDTLRLQIPPYQNRQAQSSPYLNSPVSPTPYLSSPLSPPSSTLSLSPGGLAAAFCDFSLADESLLEETFSLNSEQNVIQDPFSLSGGQNASSDGLNLIISVANDQVNNVYPSSATSEEELNDIFNETISLNFDTADHSSSPFGSYISSQHGEGASSFLAPHSPISPAPGAFPGADMLPTTFNVNGGPLQRRHSHSHASAPRSHSACGFTGSSLMPPEGDSDNSQPRRHSHSHSNPCISLMTSGISVQSSSSLLSPDAVSAESNINQLQRRHSHSSGSQRPTETVGHPHRRARSIHGHSPYARPRDIGPADAYPTPKSDDHLLARSDTRTPEHSAPPSPLPSSSPHSRNIQQTDDMFRRYDNASGIGYPILQRETIASDAVLQASAKRRKKVPSYECKTCGQMLTSRDNLNNHMDAHTGIRRHRCDYCHERFRTRSVLKRHQKSIKCPASRSLKKPNDPSFPQMIPS